LPTEKAALFYGDAAAPARGAATVPAQRLGTPADIAAACLFLTSPEASYISGANIVVHGGGERPPFWDAL
jgi:NAD(P)-dependent dehydrogenase (short-subunit alcohol dehydrogenase family)